MIYCGDALKVLKSLPDRSVNCCVTSPPYWGLRDYGVSGQIGLEKTIPEHITTLVEVFREVRRVLRDDGTLWVSYGDSYLQMSGNGFLTNKKLQRKIGGRADIRVKNPLKPKNILGLPWRLAFALQDDGWFLRSDIIWHKPNAMPESVKDRPEKAHEYVFLLSKKPKYYYDNEAIKESTVSNENAKGFRGGCFVGGELDNGTMGKRKVVGNTKSHSFARNSKRPGGQHREEREDIAYSGAKRNARSVWTIATQACKEAHFATFPDELAARCIKAGCPDGGIVLDPFLGSGTTYAVANGLGRKAIGIELNPEYVEIARGKIGMFVEVIA